MAKKNLLLGLSFTCSIICLLIGILTPIILQIVVTDMIKDKLVLTKSNDHENWGEVPGKLHAKIIQKYHMFNLSNPEEVMQGGVPSISELSGYSWQEFDKFINISYGDHIEYNLLRYAKKTDKTPWPEDRHEDDLITTVSLAAFGGWDIVKHYNRPQLALIGLYVIALSLETVLPPIAYSIGISTFMIGEKVANHTIFIPANLTQEQAQNVWNDPDYGLNNWIPIMNWIAAIQENTLTNGTFILNRPISGMTATIQRQFGLSLNQLTSLLSGHMFDLYTLISASMAVDYNCSIPDNEYMCTNQSLAAIQWSSCSITAFPPAIAPLGPSIYNVNDSVSGYPEIFYYYNSSSTKYKFPNVNFDREDYDMLFNYNRDTGYPILSDGTLLDVGQINKVFSYGEASDFDGLSTFLGLNNTDKARVLWDYINAIIDYTVLQGCFDPNIYNVDNRGFSGEAGLGLVGSQTLYNFTMFMSKTLLISVTSLYDKFMFIQNGVSCSSVVGGILGNDSICKNYKLDWNDGGLALWIQTYWNDENSTYWNEFQSISGLSYNQMTLLFAEGNTLTSSFAEFDSQLKNNYKCPNAGGVCDSWFLAREQWANSLVTMNFPSIFANYNIKNSSSITNYPFLSGPYKGTPEYSAFAQTIGKPPLVNITFNDELLSFTGFYSMPLLQKFFVYLFAQNYTGVTEFFYIQDVGTMADYMRFFIDKYFLGGLFQAKTVLDILFTDADPLIDFQINLNPLLGGNPALSRNMTQVALNRSEEIIPLTKDFRNRMNAGKKDIHNLREYSKIMGKDYINIPMKIYYGQLADGNMNIAWSNVNPWAAEIPAGGTDGWMFHPFLDSDEHLHYYLDIGAIPFKIDFDEHKEHFGYSCMKYKIDNAILMNSTTIPSQARFYQNGPDGLTNETGIFTAPVFGSKPFFYDGDQALYDMIDFKEPWERTKDNCDSYFIAEKHTSIVVKGNQLIQYNVELKPDVLYPNLAKMSLAKYGKRTYLPFCIYQRAIHLSQDQVDDKIGALKVVPKFRLAGQIIGYTLGGILFILSVWICCKRRRAHRISEREQISIDPLMTKRE